MHGCLARSQVLPGNVKAEHFRIGRNGEEDSRDNRALDHGARNCFKRIARFSAQRGGALKSDETEKRKHKAEPQAAARHAAKVQLLSVQMKNVERQHLQYN